MRASSRLAFARLMRSGRHEQSLAVFVASSTTKPVPSQCGHSLTAGPSLEALPGVVEELRVLLLEGQRDVPDRAVAVLGDDDVGLALALGLAVVVLLAVDEGDE